MKITECLSCTDCEFNAKFPCSYCEAHPAFCPRHFVSHLLREHYNNRNAELQACEVARGMGFPEHHPCKWQDLCFELLSEVRQWVAPGSIKDTDAPRVLRAMLSERAELKQRAMPAPTDTGNVPTCGRLVPTTYDDLCVREQGHTGAHRTARYPVVPTKARIVDVEQETRAAPDTAEKQAREIVREWLSEWLPSEQIEEQIDIRLVRRITTALQSRGEASGGTEDNKHV